jgi:nitroreductase
MQTWDAITSRRNVRSFADRPIPAAELDQILEAGRRAPSSQNWQPWDFIVVTDRGQLRELLGFPEDRGWALLISLGYPSDRPLTPIRKPDRRPFGEVVHRGRW